MWSFKSLICFPYAGITQNQVTGSATSRSRSQPGFPKLPQQSIYLLSGVPGTIHPFAPGFQAAMRRRPTPVFELFGVSTGGWVPGASLASGFKEDNGSCYSGVERLGGTEHGD